MGDEMKPFIRVLAQCGQLKCLPLTSVKNVCLKGNEVARALFAAQALTIALL